MSRDADAEPVRSRWLMSEGRLVRRQDITVEIGLPIRLRMARLGREPVRAAVVAATLYSVLFAIALIGVTATVDPAGELRGPSILLAIVNGLAFAGLAWVTSRRARRAEGLAAERANALLRAEHSAVSGMIAAAVGHDLRNALQVANFSIELLDNGGRSGDDYKALAQLRRSIEMMSELAEGLHTGGANGFAGLKKRFDVVETLQDVIEASASHPRLQECELVFEPAHGAELDGVRRLVTRAVMNLVLNAAEAGSKGTRIVVSTRVEGDLLVIAVDDDGPGVPKDDRQRVFQPFYSTRGHGGGGLGLVSAVACAEHHGGRVTVSDSPLGGARFELVLPGARRKEDRAQAEAG